MFGRVRASSMDSLETLEMERPPSKIIKHDSLSIYVLFEVGILVCVIYMLDKSPTPLCSLSESRLIDVEATLLKLKQGAHCNSTQTTEDSAKCVMETDSPEEVEILTNNSADSSSTDSSTISSSNSQSKQYESRDISILYLFSKYKSSQHDQSSNVRDLAAVSSCSSTYSSSSVSSSPNSSS